MLLQARMLPGVGISVGLMAPLTGYRRCYAPASKMLANSWRLMTGAMGMSGSTLPVQWLVPLVGWRLLFLGAYGMVNPWVSRDGSTADRLIAEGIPACSVISAMHVVAEGVINMRAGVLWAI